MGMRSWSAVLASLLWAATVRADGVVRVAAAADLELAFKAIVAAYAAPRADTIRVTFGSSGQFFTQLMAGAPFDIFMAADEALIERLNAAGLTRDAGHRYAAGRLVLYALRDAPFTPDAELADLKRALARGALGKIAIANPEHAPYGRAAREVLAAVGLWDALQGRLVFGENVAQAAQFATSGAASGGLFALSLTAAPVVTQNGRFVLVPDTLHSPLHQRMVLMRSASPQAAAFYTYLRGADAAGMLREYGFGVP